MNSLAITLPNSRSPGLLSQGKGMMVQAFDESRRRFLKLASAASLAPKMMLQRLLTKKSPLSTEEGLKVLQAFRRDFSKFSNIHQGKLVTVDNQYKNFDAEAQYREVFDLYQTILENESLRNLVKEGKLDSFFNQLSEDGQYLNEMIKLWYREQKPAFKIQAELKARALRNNFYIGLKRSILEAKTILPSPERFMTDFKTELDAVKQFYDSTKQASHKLSEDLEPSENTLTKKQESIFARNNEAMLYAMKHLRPQHETSQEKRLGQ